MTTLRVTLFGRASLLVARLGLLFAITSPVSASIIGHGKPGHGKLVWEETFDLGKTGAQPDPAIWGYEQGGSGWGNGELETYCAWGSSKGPCNTAEPNAFVGSDRLLHIVARRTADGQYTSARMISLGRKDFKYGRIEARIQIPRGTGIWPAFWLLGSDSQTNHWPKCGEIDVMESIGEKEPTIIHGTLHGPGFPAVGYGKPAELPDRAAYANAFHNYGMLWSPGRIAFYVDDPKKPYAVFTPADLRPGAVWPFDARSFYLLLNVAVGGGWPGSPDARTAFPAEMLVKSIRVWELK